MRTSINLRNIYGIRSISLKSSQITISMRSSSNNRSASLCLRSWFRFAINLVPISSQPWINKFPQVRILSVPGPPPPPPPPLTSLRLPRLPRPNDKIEHDLTAQTNTSRSMEAMTSLPAVQLRLLQLLLLQLQQLFSSLLHPIELGYIID